LTKRGYWRVRPDGTFGPPRHWYAEDIYACVICGREEHLRERVYRKSEAGKRYRETACQSHFL
jgi:hypothetical protein